MTPVPTVDIQALSLAVTRIEVGVKTIKDDLLPPVSESARVAKDGLIELAGVTRDINRRLDAVESAPPRPHDTCDSLKQMREKVTGVSGTISGHERELAGLSKWRWWLMGIAVTLGLFGAGLAGRALLAQGEAFTDRGSLRRDIDRHEESIKSLTAAREADRNAIIREVRAVPTKVHEARPSLNDVLREEPLTDREKRAIQDIVTRANRRVAWEEAKTRRAAQQ